MNLLHVFPRRLLVVVLLLQIFAEPPVVHADNIVTLLTGLRRAKTLHLKSLHVIPTLGLDIFY